VKIVFGTFGKKSVIHCLGLGPFEKPLKPNQKNGESNDFKFQYICAKILKFGIFF
jgi:hypothetical protein